MILDQQYHPSPNPTHVPLCPHLAWFMALLSTPYRTALPSFTTGLSQPAHKAHVSSTTCSQNDTGCVGGAPKHWSKELGITLILLGGLYPLTDTRIWRLL